MYCQGALQPTASGSSSSCRRSIPSTSRGTSRSSRVHTTPRPSTAAAWHCNGRQKLLGMTAWGAGGGGAS